ncbi:MAG: UPF0182 family protein, partial [Bacteroidota bacterium]
MYTILLIILLAVAAIIGIKGVRNQRKPLIVTGVILALLTILFFWFMGFWGDKLWFDHMGYNDRFWTEWLSKIGLFAGAFIIGGLLVLSLTYSIRGERKYIRWFAVGGAALLSGFWWYSRWDIFLRFIHRINTDLIDPILNMQTGFYLFSYPFLQTLYTHLLILLVISAGASLLGFIDIKNENR